MKKLNSIKFILEIVLIVIMFHLCNIFEESLTSNIKGFERVSANGRIIIDKNKSVDKLITIGATFKTKQLILDYNDIELEDYLGTYMNYLKLNEIDYIFIKNKDYIVYKHNEDLYVSTNLFNKNKYYRIEEIKDNKILLGKSKFFLKPLNHNKIVDKINLEYQDLYNKVYNKILVIQAQNI